MEKGLARFAQGTDIINSNIEGDAMIHQIPRVMQIYRVLAVLLLTLTAMFKIISLARGDFGDQEFDPVFGLKSVWVIGGVAALELLVVAAAFMDKSHKIFLNLCMGLFGCFLAYHFFNFLTPGEFSCSCLGVPLSKKLLVGPVGKTILILTSLGMFVSAAFVRTLIEDTRRTVSSKNTDRAMSLSERVEGNKLLLHLFLILMPWSNASASIFETTGMVEVVNLRYDGTVNEDPRLSYDTPVTVKLADDGRFIMDLAHHPAFHGNISFAFDGTNWFYGFGSRTRSQQDGNPAPTGVGPQTAYLSAGEIPMILFQDDARDALWMALGSGSYFSKHGPSGEFVNLFYGPRTDINAYGFRYEATLTNSVLPLPYKLQVWKDKSLDKKDPDAEQERIGLDLKNKGSDLRRRQWALKESWQDGGRAIEMAWNRAQHLGNLSLPLAVEITNYFAYPHPAPPQSRISIELATWSRIEDTNETFQPPVKEPIRVWDSRLRSRDAGHYVDDVLYQIGKTNFQWFATNDVRLENQFRSLMEASPRPDAAFPMVLRILLFVVLASALVITVKLIVRKKHTGSQ